MDSTKVVKHIESKTGQRGEYWTVTWDDDRTDNVFNPDWLALLQQSKSQNAPLYITKERNGKFYNIKSLALDDTPAGLTPSLSSLAAPPPPPPPKTDWAEKDRITRKSIERQTSLNAAVEIAKLHPVEQATTERIIATARKFEDYLDGSYLAEAVKRAGGVEVAK